MADTVRYIMEDMVPELEDMQRRGYFTRAEIKEVVRRRQEFEYKLKRKAAIKQDYYSYAEYETKLDALRAARRRGLGLQSAKKTLADFALVRRVHFIFERAARKFKRDLDVWTRWLEFCRASRSNRRLSRVAARALQVRPDAAGLWAYAAAWELDENHNPSAARALLQQGLRVCKDSRELWVHYFGMELAYVAKLRARRIALGLDVPSADGDGGGDGQQQAGGSGKGDGSGEGGAHDDEEAGAANGGGGGGDDGDGEGPDDGEGAGGPEGTGSILATLRKVEGKGAQQQQQQQQEQEQQQLDPAAAIAAVLSGGVAAIVARNAAAARPRDLELRRQLLAAAGQHDWPGAARVAAGIAAQLEADFGGAPAAVDALARFHCDPSDPAAPSERAAAAAQRFEDAISAASDAAAAAAAAATAAEPGSGEAEPEPGAAAAERRKRRRLLESDLRAAAEARADLWRRYAEFLYERFTTALTASAAAAAAATRRAGNAAVEQRVAETAAAAQALLSALQRAHEAHAAGERVYELWADAALQLEQPKLALRAAKLGCEALPANAAVWARRLSIEARVRGADGAGRLLKVLRAALAAAPAENAPELWLAAIDACASASARGSGKAVPPELQQLADLFVGARLGAPRGPATGGIGAAAARLLAAVWEAGGEAAGRALFDRLAALPPPGGDFYRAALRLEGCALDAAGGSAAATAQHQPDNKQQQQQSAGSAAATKLPSSKQQLLARARRVLEAAVDAYGAEDAGLWLAYARLESGPARRGAGRVYWRAVRALADPDPFILAFKQEMGDAAAAAAAAVAAAGAGEKA